MTENLYDINPKFGGQVSGERWWRQQSTFIHVVNRVWERYKIRVKIEDIKYWNNCIIHGFDNCLWVLNDNNDTSQYIIIHNNKQILTLFDIKRWTIVTALPKYRIRK